MSGVRIALVQFSSSSNKKENLSKAIKIIKKVRGSADIAVFPEYMMGYTKDGLSKEWLNAQAEDLNGNFISELSAVAKEVGLWLLINMFEKDEDGIYNTNVVLDGNGEIVAKYRKIHLFDAYGYRESDLFKPGKELVTFDLSGVRFGLTICFDVRFPELYRALALRGALAFLTPAAWYVGLMKEWQWILMGSARAHENVAFFVGVGNSNQAFVGRSMVADPYGIIRLDMGAGEKVGFFDIDPNEVEDAKKVLPLLKLRRLGVPNPIM